MADQKTNYTVEQTQEIVQLYQEGATVEQIAEQFARSARSIIAKLSREGVYKPKQKAAGSKRVTKAQLLREVEQKLGLEPGVLSSLEKGSHEALEVLQAAVMVQ